VCPGEAETQLPAEVADAFEHALPLGENDDFGVVGGALLENLFQFGELLRDVF
jgi:hypothetical protein